MSRHTNKEFKHRFGVITIIVFFVAAAAQVKIFVVILVFFVCVHVNILFAITRPFNTWI